jgi:hypothetical protein
MEILYGLFGPKRTRKALALLIAKVIAGTLERDGPAQLLAGTLHIALNLRSVSVTAASIPTPSDNFITSLRIADVSDASVRAFFRAIDGLEPAGRDAGIAVFAAKIVDALAARCHVIGNLPGE